MYQKIKDSLFYPKRLATSYQRKTIWFVIFLIILSSLPFILHTCVNGFLTHSDVRNIKTTLATNSPIEYRIANHQLIAYEENTPNRYIIISEGSLGIAFINNNEEEMIVSEQFVIMLDKDGLYFCLPYIGGVNFKLADYSLLEDIDFKDAKSTTNDEFWSQIFGYVNSIIDDIKIWLYPIYFLFIIIQMTISILMGIFTNALILIIFDRTPGVKFTEVFKNSTIAFFPYVITVILSYAFNLGFLQYIGNIISFIYAMIAHNEYRKIKYKEMK